MISGKNASGKTNLLEAIYFFSTLRSFRTLYRKEILQEGEEASQLNGCFGGAAAGMRLDIRLSHASRKIMKDDKELSNISDHFYNLPMVLFHPANLALVQGGPRERRRYMDRALYQADRSYPALLGDYNRALLNRNRLLKTRPNDLSLLAPYDIQLADLGSRIVSARMRFITKAGAVFSNALSDIGDGIRGEMVYRPNIFGEEGSFLDSLVSCRKRDIDRGFTGKGPHADDLEIRISGRSAKRFASQGQQRMSVLSMKIAEVLTLSEVTNRIPILLLDDISSELDRDRNQALFAFLNDVGGQVFITTTHLDHVRLSDQRTDFLIEGGIVTAA